jgi:hypothetical protein
VITLNWESMQGDIGALMGAFNELPRHIAKKHLLATIRRVGKVGVPVLKSNTPVGKTTNVKSTIRRGQTVENSKRRGGALRRASTVVARYKGKNKDGFAYGVLERFIEGFGNTALREVLGFSVMILLLLMFPNGLFGQREVNKV